MRTLQSELVEKGLYQKSMNKRPHKRKRNRKRKLHPVNTCKNTEKLSRQDWEEIMGTRRPRYRRNRGAFRQL